VTDGTACTSSTQCTLNATCQAGSCTGTTCSTGLCGTSLSAFGGAQTAGWNLSGNAAYDSGANTVVLVDGQSTGEAGTAIYQNTVAADSFTVSFDFKLTTTGTYTTGDGGTGSYGRADGIIFMIEKTANNAVGQGFGGFAALGLDGYGVELDVFDSGPCDPGNGNHAGVDLLSPCGTNSGIPSPIATSNDLFDGSLPGNGVGDIGDGTWRTATIQLASGQVSVAISGSQGTINVPNLQNVALSNFTSGTPYYLGFGAGTGSNGLSAKAEIRNVSVTFGSEHCL